MFYKNFLKKPKFDNYKDYIENATPIVPGNFNFAYDVVDKMAIETPDKIALLWTDDTDAKIKLSYKKLSEMSNAAANFLTSRGIKHGSPVLLFLRRRWEYWVLMMALHKIGAVAIPSTNMLRAHDIKYRIDEAEVKNIIVFDDGNIIKEIKQAAMDKDVQIITTTELISEMEKFPNTMERILNEATDTMIIYFTSGTTGMPKMVAHDFSYPLGHINTAVFWHGLDDSDIHFTLAESGWAKCSWGKMYGQWLAGATVFVYDFSGAFSPHNLCRVMSENKVTSFCAPPTAYKLLIREHIDKFDMSNIKKSSVAGEALNPETFAKYYELTGVKPRDGFGQSETCVMLFSNEWIEPKPGSMGMPAAGWNIELLGEDGNPVPNGEPGEICLSLKNGRPVGLFRGYHKNEEKNAAAFRNGYYHTGDVARRDENGYFWFIGRNDDLIKASGYRISPFEVESVLLEHPSVKEVAVTAAESEIRGTVVKATIVLCNGFSASPELAGTLCDFVKSRTAPYKCPRIVNFVESLPMTISGKIKRAEIRKADAAKKN